MNSFGPHYQQGGVKNNGKNVENAKEPTAVTNHVAMSVCWQHARHTPPTLHPSSSSFYWENNDNPPLPCTSLVCGGGSGNLEAHTVNACSGNNRNRTSGSISLPVTNDIGERSDIGKGDNDGSRPIVGRRGRGYPSTVDVGYGACGAYPTDQRGFYYNYDYHYLPPPLRHQRNPSATHNSPHNRIKNDNCKEMNCREEESSVYLHYPPPSTFSYSSRKRRNNLHTAAAGTPPDFYHKKHDYNSLQLAESKMQHKLKKVAELATDSIPSDLAAHTITNSKSNKPNKYYKDQPSPSPPAAVATTQHLFLYSPSIGYSSSHKDQISNGKVLSVVCSGERNQKETQCLARHEEHTSFEGQTQQRQQLTIATAATAVLTVPQAVDPRPYPMATYPPLVPPFLNRPPLLSHSPHRHNSAPPNNNINFTQQLVVVASQQPSLSLPQQQYGTMAAATFVVDERAKREERMNRKTTSNAPGGEKGGGGGAQQEMSRASASSSPTPLINGNGNYCNTNINEISTQQRDHHCVMNSMLSTFVDPQQMVRVVNARTAACLQPTPAVVSTTSRVSPLPPTHFSPPPRIIGAYGSDTILSLTEMGRHVLADRFRTQLCRNYLKKKAEIEKEEKKRNTNKLQVASGESPKPNACLRSVAAHTTHDENTNNKRERVPMTAASALVLLESYCPYESRCLFAHGEDQLRTAAQNITDGLTSEESIKVFKQREREERWRRLVAEREEWERKTELKNAENATPHGITLPSAQLQVGVEVVAPSPPYSLPAVTSILLPSALSTPKENSMVADLTLLYHPLIPADALPMAGCHSEQMPSSSSSSPSESRPFLQQQQEEEEGEITAPLPSSSFELHEGAATSDCYHPRHHNLDDNYCKGDRDGFEEDMYGEDRALHFFNYLSSPQSPQEGLSFFIERAVMLPESLIAPASSHASQNALTFTSIPSYLPQVPTLSLAPPTPPRRKEEEAEEAPREGGTRGLSHENIVLLSYEMGSEKEKAGSRAKTSAGQMAVGGPFSFSRSSPSSSIGDEGCCVVCSCEYQPVSSRWTCSRHAHRRGKCKGCDEDAFSPSQHSPLSALSSRPSPAHPYTHNPYAPPIPPQAKKVGIW